MAARVPDSSQSPAFSQELLPLIGLDPAPPAVPTRAKRSAPPPPDQPDGESAADSASAATEAATAEPAREPAAAAVETGRDAVAMANEAGPEAAPAETGPAHADATPADQAPVADAAPADAAPPATPTESGLRQGELLAAAELPVLPPELEPLAKSLRRCLNDAAQLPQAFAAFCSAAYVKPEWAGVASDYLAALFENQQDLLADMMRVPDLIIELATGHYALTFMVASRWAAKSDTARLARLAEALVATQSKMTGPEAVDIMLALATSLAICRYPRAEQLLSVAEPLASDEHREAVAEARLWLAAGRVVRGCSQEARDLWEQRLRRGRNLWAWDSREEREALAQLSNYLDEGADCKALFQAVVPACWWDLALVRVREHAVFEAAQVSVTEPPPEPEPASEEFEAEEADPEAQDEAPPAESWPAVPFFLGGLVGAWALTLGIWLGPFDLLRPGEAAPAAPPPPAGAPAVQEPPEHPHTTWRRQQADALRAENPGFQRLLEEVERGDWAKSQALLRGETADLPKDGSQYAKFLLLLHYDPPSNAEIRAHIPGLLAGLQADSALLELWEKLVYPGSANGQEIRLAARRQHHENGDAWSPSQRAQLNRIGWESPAP